MSKAIISVENLGKKFVIGHQQTQRQDTFRDAMVNTIGNISKRSKQFFSGKKNNDLNTTEDFWALKNINFEVEQGDRIGVIGRNGAGKSTLLKVLSRITDPTEGSIRIKGRVASLLEVGTGFHPELSGRENIFLNGAILGMSRAEIRSKFDEIVAFAEVERFLDTPVKRYSSGMYVRLAFAVAAHLEPEILVVDEVLAVGDIQFQKKCLGKMEDVSKNQGRTVLFVSHNMVAIKALCNKGVFLQGGRLKQTGDINNIIQAYLQNKNIADKDGNIPDGSSTYNTGIARYTKIKIVNHTGDGHSVFYGSPIKIFAEIESQQDLNAVILDLRICNAEGLQIVHAGNVYDSNVFATTQLKKGTNRIEILMDNFLQPGRYSFTPGIHQQDGASMDYVENILDFEVLRIGKDNDPGYQFSWEMGIIRFNSDWKINA